MLLFWKIQCFLFLSLQFWSSNLFNVAHKQKRRLLSPLFFTTTQRCFVSVRTNRSVFALTPSLRRPSEDSQPESSKSGFVCKPTTAIKGAKKQTVSAQSGWSHLWTGRGRRRNDKSQPTRQIRVYCSAFVSLVSTVPKFSALQPGQ